MTKRDLENKLEDLNEEILGNLSSDERLQLLLEASARGLDERTESLIKHAPPPSYIFGESSFSHRATVAYTTAQAAVSDLHTALVWYISMKSIHDYSVQVTLRHDDLPPHPLTSIEGLGPLSLFTQLYVAYKTYHRFAEKELGVPFETWVDPVPDGKLVAEAIPEIIAEKEGEMWRYHESSEKQDSREIDLSADPDQVAEEAYENLVDAYQAAISN